MGIHTRIGDMKEQQAVKMDLRDKKILSILSENSRLSVAEIAKRLGINRDTVKYKIKRMQDNGVLRKFYAEINLGVFGYSTCHVYFLLDELHGEAKEALLKDLLNNPHTKSVMEYHDRWDMEWILVTQGLEQFDKLMTEIMSKHQDCIIEKNQLVTLQYYYTTRLPYDFYKQAGYQLKQTNHTVDKIKLDEYDFKILQRLAENARENAVETALHVGLSTDAVIRRIKRLYDAHIINRFTSLIDRRKLDYNWFTFAITMKSFDKKSQSTFREFIREHPHIIRCVKTYGKFDLLLSVCAKEPQHFHNTIKDIKKTFFNRIKRYESWVAYKEHCFRNFPAAISYDDVRKG